MDNYTKLIERIAKAASLSVEEIDRKVEAKRAKLSGLISKEGAAQIIAAELGVNLEKEKLKIGELNQGMKRVHVVGKVMQVFPVRSYNKNGREGKVASLLLADETSNIRVVFWDLNHIKLIEDGTIKVGQTLELSNGVVRNGELHLSSFADVKLSNEEMEEIFAGNPGKAQKLKDAKVGQRIQTEHLCASI
jgi:OB-fold nucleic acid binding domain.